MPERLGSRRLPRLGQQAPRWLCWSGPTGSAPAGGHATTTYGSTRRAGCRRSPAIAPAVAATASTRPGTRGSATSRTVRPIIASTFVSARRCGGTQVRRVEPAEEEWRLETDGEGLRARFVAIATGFDHDPELPDWPARDSFSGGLIHSSAYRNPEPYRGRDVLVVGPGTTGSEVATLLARGGAGRVRVACISARARPARSPRHPEPP